MGFMKSTVYPSVLQEEQLSTKLSSTGEVEGCGVGKMSAENWVAGELAVLVNDSQIHVLLLPLCSFFQKYESDWRDILQKKY